MVSAVAALVLTGCVTVQRDTGLTEPSAGPSTSPGAARSNSPSSPRPSAAPATTAPTLTPDASSLLDGPIAPPTPSPTPPPTTPPRSDEPSIGYISLDESLPFVRSVSSGIRSAAASAGLPLHECDPRWSRSGVLDCAAQLAQAGVHGVVSFQPFADLAEDVCATIGAAPVVGVVFDQGTCEVSRLTIDQRASGRLAGEAVGAFADEEWDCGVNAWISLESSDADPDGRARMQGYREGYQTHCPLPDESYTLDDADRLVTAQIQLEELLPTLQGKRNIVVGLNEDAILGAMAAAEASGRQDQLWYSGQLADPSIRQRIACDPHYIASVAQFPEPTSAQ